MVKNKEPKTDNLLSIIGRWARGGTGSICSFGPMFVLQHVFQAHADFGTERLQVGRMHRDSPEVTVQLVRE